MSDQMPFIDVEFVDNPEPRCPCVLVLDVSSSMRGAAIDYLNLGVDLFAHDLTNSRLACKRVETAVITFGEGVQIVQDFVSPSAFVPPRFEAGGKTPMGEAIVKACDLLNQRKRKYRAAGVSYFRPWIFLITDGEPTDYKSAYWQKAVELVREGEADKKLMFFGVAVNEADQGKLNELCPPARPAIKLNGLDFQGLFTWLSSSLRTVSSANPGTQGIVLPSITGWAMVNV
jgi:uncharacterized protein YegL